MSKLTAKEIIEALKERFTSPDVYLEESYSHPISALAYGDYDAEPLNLGEIYEVDSYGGEGQGDRWWKILYFKEHNVHLKITGFYQSHNGVDFYDGWNCLKEVSPKSKTITVYE